MGGDVGGLVKSNSTPVLGTVSVYATDLSKIYIEEAKAYSK